jgi:hypothetical protein
MILMCNNLLNTCKGTISQSFSNGVLSTAVSAAALLAMAFSVALSAW